MEIDVNSLATSLGTVGATLAAVLFALRRRASRDTVEIAKDRAEESVITHLEKQRDQAVEDVSRYTTKLMVCEAEKTDAITKISRLNAEVQHLTGQVKILKDLVEKLGNTLDSTRMELQSYMAENAKLLAKVEILEKQNDRRTR